MDSRVVALDVWLNRRADAGHRALIVATGEHDAAIAWACRYLDALRGVETLTLSFHPDAPPPVRHAPPPGQLVGREFDAVVLDVFSGFDADTLGAVAGTVRGGGVILLCAPPLDAWAGFNDPGRGRLAIFGPGGDEIDCRYLRRFARLLDARGGAWIVDAARDPVPSTPLATRTVDLGWTSDEQREAVAALCHVVSGQRRRPVVLSADRGRGKSAALGMAAAALLHQGARRVVLTAADRGAVRIVLRHAEVALGPGSRAAPGICRLGDRVIEFVEPGRLLDTDAPADLVLVDEAAALPLHWLESALRRFSRIAFATTVHGYEGSGRGFATRFGGLLDRHTRGWRTVRLAEPVRYAANDPVESFLFDALLLDAEPAELDPCLDRRLGDLRVTTLDRDRLSDNEPLLRQYFGLLVASHYRTRPNDLRYLLDAPNLELVAAFEDERVIGAAVIAREGGFDESTAARVAAGRSRPRGHLLVETLCVQLGETGWLPFTGMRVVRIAVHPARRRCGVGTTMLNYVADAAAAAGCDYIGSSFAVGVEVARFWRSAGYVPLWLSTRRNATSGVRSLLVARAVTPAASTSIRRTRNRFLEGFAIRLAGQYADEDPAHVLVLYEDCTRLPGPGAADLAAVARFADHEGGFDACFSALWRTAQVMLSRSVHLEGLNERERHLLVRVVLQQWDRARAGSEIGLAGRRAVTDCLAAVFRRFVEKSIVPPVTGP